MRVLATVVLSVLAGLASLTRATEGGDYKAAACPTVTSTAEVCHTCALLKCLAIETISLRKECPLPVATKTTSYPCRGKKCPAGCGATSYVTVTPSPPASACPTVTSTGSVCSTCVRPQCVIAKTIGCQEGCPAPVPTVHTEMRCGGRCPGGCGTFYVYETSGCEGKPTPTPGPEYGDE
ncbi:hypothetical protein CDD83_5763 [Cordyceps sp. RAO-2017]|nr:hypothetical protein CDD83_5763 [Cordyceps sp. RAO-2017]